MMQIRNGDVVTVRLTVDDKDPMGGNRVLFSDPTGRTFGVNRSDIVSVESRPLQVGDLVTHPCHGSGNLLTIEAIHDGYAWLRFCHALGQYATYPVTQLVRAE